MAYITAKELEEASQDAGTLDKFANDPAGVPNINRVGNDVENMMTLRKRMLDAAADVANRKVYLTEAEMLADTSQPINTPARVETGSGAGDYIMTAEGWVWSDVQPANAEQVARIEQTVQDIPVYTSPRQFIPGMRGVFVDSSSKSPAAFDDSGKFWAAMRVMPWGANGKAFEGGPNFSIGNDWSVTMAPFATVTIPPIGYRWFIGDGRGAMAIGLKDNGNVFIGKLEGYPTPAEFSALQQAVDVIEQQIDSSSSPVEQQEAPFAEDNKIKLFSAEGTQELFDATPLTIQAQATPYWHQKGIVVALNKPLMAPVAPYVITKRRTGVNTIGNMLVPGGKYMFIWPSTGQSNDMGALGQPLIPPFDQPFEPNAFMLNGTGTPQHNTGVRLVPDTGTVGNEPVYDPATATDFIPLVSTAFGSRGVSHMEGFAAQMHRIYRERLGFDVPSVYVTGGFGGRLQVDLAEGTIPFENLIKGIQRACEIARAKGYIPIVPAVLVVHGESDSARAVYMDGIVSWQTSYEARIKAITGQLGSIPFICSQASTFSVTTGTPIQNRARYGVLAPFAASRLHPGKFYVAGSYYTLPMNSDYLHLTNVGHFKNGENLAFAAEAAVFGQREMGGFEPTVAAPLSIIDSQTVRLSSLPMVGSPVLDDTHPLNPPNPDGGHGFEFFDGETGETVPVIDFDIDGRDLIIRAETAIPEGQYRGLGYALKGYNNPKAAGEQGRGQIRDERGTLSVLDGQPLHTWMPHFLISF